MLVCAATAAAQSPIPPPYGLRWGDSPEKLVEWASKHAFDLTLTQPGDQPALRILRISPRQGFLPDSRANAVEARFLYGRLFEVTIHYTDPDAGADAMEARFEALRRELVQRHGPMKANRQDRQVEDQFVTRTQSFHREPVKGMFLLLAYTEMEDLLRQRKDSRFSLVYRNDNYRAELEKTPAARPVGP